MKEELKEAFRQDIVAKAAIQRIVILSVYGADTIEDL